MLSLEAVAKSGGWIDLLLDGEPWQTVHRDLLPLNPLPASVASPEEGESLLERGALHYLGRLLSQREYLSRQLLQRLIQRGVERERAATLIRTCEERGLIDDRRWVQGYLLGQKRRMRGPAAVTARLRAKGVSSTLIEEEVVPLCDADEQRLTIEQLLDGRLSGYDREKAYRALVRRGFDIELIVEQLNWKRG